MNKKIEFKFYKSEESFINQITFLRGFFKDGEWIDILNEKHVHINGITRDLAKQRYYEEIDKVKKHKKINKFMPKSLQQPHIYYYVVYQAIISLMDVLNKDFLTADDIDYILRDPSYFFSTYFDKSLNTDGSIPKIF